MERYPTSERCAFSYFFRGETWQMSEGVCFVCYDEDGIIPTLLTVGDGLVAFIGVQRDDIDGFTIDIKGVIQGSGKDVVGLGLGLNRNERAVGTVFVIERDMFVQSVQLYRETFIDRLLGYGDARVVIF